MATATTCKMLTPLQTTAPELTRIHLLPPPAAYSCGSVVVCIAAATLLPLLELLLPDAGWSHSRPSLVELHEKAVKKSKKIY